MENPEPLASYASLLRGIVQLFVMVPNPIAEGYPALFLVQLVKLFLTPRLNGKIGLRCTNLGLGRVPIHRDQVASIAREKTIFSFDFCSTSCRNHLLGIKKVVRAFQSRTLARILCLIDHILEIVPFRVSQNQLYFAAHPVLALIRVNAFEAL